jgi:hypothetical protein
MRRASLGLLGLCLSSIAFAQAPNCLRDMDATFEQARAVLRAHNCENSSSLEECETHLGLGAGGASMMAALGAKTALGVRDPHFGICAIAKRNPFFEEAHAGACLGNDIFAQQRLSDLNEKMRKAYQVAIDEQKKEIKAIEDRKFIDPKQAEADLISEIQKAEQGKQEVAKQMRAANQAQLEKLQVQQNESVQKLTKAYREKYGRDVINARQLEDFAATLSWGNEKEAAIKNMFHQVQMREAKMKSLASPISIGGQNDFVKWENRKAELESQLSNLKRNPPKGLNPQDTKAVQETLKKMNQRLSDLTANHEALEQISKVVPTYNLPSATDMRTSLELMKEMSGYSPALAHEVSLTAQVVSWIEAGKTPATKVIQNTSYSGTLQSLKAGKVKKVAISAVTSVGVSTGMMTVARAAEVEEFVDAADPVSALLTAGNKQTCSDLVSARDAKLFPPTVENNCKPDLSIDSKSVKFLNMDKSELQTAIKEYPELCEFIRFNFAKKYPRVTGLCTEKGATARFADGSWYELSDERVSYYAQRTTKKPVSLEFRDGAETVISRPAVATRQGADLKTDLTKMTAQNRNETLDEIYQGNKTVLSEIRRCCVQGGVRPSAQDCSRYGIQMADHSQAPDAGAAGTQ